MKWKLNIYGMLRTNAEGEDGIHSTLCLKRENTHYNSQIHVDTQYGAQTDHQQLVFLLLSKLHTQKGRMGEYL